jgi:hypothetical protein
VLFAATGNDGIADDILEDFEETLSCVVDEATDTHTNSNLGSHERSSL